MIFSNCFTPEYTVQFEVLSFTLNECVVLFVELHIEKVEYSLVVCNSDHMLEAPVELLRKNIDAHALFRSLNQTLEIGSRYLVLKTKQNNFDDPDMQPGLRTTPLFW